MRFQGKHFVVVFGVVLLALLVLGFSVNHHLNTATDIVEAQRDVWPKVASIVDERCAQVESAATVGDVSAMQNWRDLRNRFNDSVIYDKQARVFPALARATIELTRDYKLKLVPLTEMEQQTVQEFIQLDRARSTMMISLSGRVAQAILRLDYPNSVSDELTDLLTSSRAN